MSPELLDPDRFGLRDGRPTKRSDCYALGMVILEVLSGKPPFPNYNGMTVMRKIVEGERPGRPEGEEGVWFTADLWGMLEQCWSLHSERRPTIDNVLQCLRRGSMGWQPLPPDSGDHSRSDGDEESDFTLSHDQSIDPSVFLDLFLDLTHPQTAFVVDRIDPQDDDRTPVLFQNKPRGVYASRVPHRPSPGNQQRLTKPPVSVTSDMSNMFSLYDNP